MVKVNDVELQKEIASKKLQDLKEELLKIFDLVEVDFGAFGVFFYKNETIVIRRVDADLDDEYLAKRALEKIKRVWIHYSEAIRKFKRFIEDNNGWDDGLSVSFRNITVTEWSLHICC